MSEQLVVETPLGPARLHVDPAGTPRVPRLTVLLGHGAGGGVEARDLAALAAADVGLPAYGITVVRVEQPWRVAGRRVAGPPASLDLAWIAVLGALRRDHRDVAPGPWVLGGRSAGARVACRTATGSAAAAGPVVGVLALAFPLQPPLRVSTTNPSPTPRPSRLPELHATGRPTLVMQGERDSFGGPGALAGRLPSTHTLHAVPGADHAFRVIRTHDQAATLRGIVEAAAGWAASIESAAGNRS